MDFTAPYQEPDAEIDALEKKVNEAKRNNIRNCNSLGSFRDALAMLMAEETELERDYQERKSRLEGLKKKEEKAEKSRKFNRYLLKSLFEQRLFCPALYKEKREKVFAGHLEYLSKIQKEVSQRKKERENLTLVKQHQNVQQLESSTAEDLQQLSTELQNEENNAKMNLDKMEKKISNIILSLVVNRKRLSEKTDETTCAKSLREKLQTNGVVLVNSDQISQLMTQSSGKLENFHIPKISPVPSTSQDDIENSKEKVEAMLSHLKRIINSTNNDLRFSPSPENVQKKDSNFSAYTHTGYIEQKSYTVSSSVTVTEIRNGVYVESQTPVGNNPLKKLSPMENGIMETSVQSLRKMSPIGKDNMEAIPRPQICHKVEPFPQNNLPKSLLSSTLVANQPPLVKSFALSALNENLIGEGLKGDESNPSKSPPVESHVEIGESKKVTVLSNVILKQAEDGATKSDPALLEQIPVPNEEGIDTTAQRQLLSNGLKNESDGISKFVDIAPLKSVEDVSHGDILDKQALKRVGDKLPPVLEVKRQRISKPVPNKLSPPAIIEGIKIRPSAETPIELNTEIPSSHITIQSSNENASSNAPINPISENPNSSPPLEKTYDILNMSNISKCASPAGSDFYKDIFKDLNVSITSAEPNDKKRKASPSSTGGFDFGDFNCEKKPKAGSKSPDDNFFENFLTEFSGNDGKNKEDGFMDFSALMG
ncbi:unnamed protein product [Hermetia illucens]|uniref:Uncharacterized protein n=1 Tax=Hermetia illucens TaxID=343691 RepID=A0A7R8UN60_HERIL|nr:unnamed protein product [Hermetia illucens]